MIPTRAQLFVIVLTIFVVSLPGLAAELHPGAATDAASGGNTMPVADGAADARRDFADGVLMLLGGEGLEAGTLDLGTGLQLEIATDACALGPDPTQYIADYNRAMKERIRAVHGVDVDDVILRAAP